MVPVTLTVEVFQDCMIHVLRIVNNSGQNAVVAVQDQQTTPITLIPTVTLPPGGILSGESNWGQWMKGGVAWSSSVAGVHGYLMVATT